MALPVLQDLKDYLRVQTTAEDSVLTSLLARAGAMVRAHLERPIELTANTYTIDRPIEDTSMTYGFYGLTYAVGAYAGVWSYPTLLIPDSPVASSPAVTITDVNGLTWASSDFRVEYDTGLIRLATLGTKGPFIYYPYTVTATVGLAVRSDYATVVEPAIGAAIVDLAADLYQRRNPAATSESSGGGTAVHYGRADESIPVRALDMLAPYRKKVLL